MVVDKTHFKQMMEREVTHCQCILLYLGDMASQCDFVAFTKVSFLNLIILSVPQVRKQVDLAMKQMKAKQDAHIFNSHDAFQRDRKMVSELLQGSIEIERNKLRALADQFSDEQRTKADLLQALDSYVKEQKQVWDVILKHPFFKGEEEEEPQEGTEGQRASSD